MHTIARKAVLIAGVAAMAAGLARAQPLDAIGDLLDQAGKSTPLDTPAPAHAISHPLSARDAALFRDAIEDARHGSVNGRLQLAVRRAQVQKWNSHSCVRACMNSE